MRSYFPPAQAQDIDLSEDPEAIESEATRRFRELTDPDAKAKGEDEKLKPPFEFYRTQVAPFDVLTYFKPNHWVTLTQEMQANLADYEGQLRTAPVELSGMPRAVVFQRDTRLVEGEPARVSWPAFLPQPSKTLDVELVRPGAIRPDDSTQAQLLPMPPHQMLMVVLANDPLSYDRWKRYQAMIPATTDTGDQQLIDRRSYYRLVIPQKPEEPNLSTHALTWTTTSHIIWDGFDPNNLNVGQQQALVDWLHWGGQLIIAGGPSASLQQLTDVESFLAPYLPGEPSGENQTLNEEDLESLSRLYPPPSWNIELLDLPTSDFTPPSGPKKTLSSRSRDGSRYLPPEPIDLPVGRSLLLTGLTELKDDCEWITDTEGHRFGLERRVGRGRILMLTFNPNEGAFQNWRGNDTFVRRVLLRRPEDRWSPMDINDKFMLAGPELSWYRLLSRDLEPTLPPEEDQDGQVFSDPALTNSIDPLMDQTPVAPVAAWLDSAKLPSLSRDTLVSASGIEIPGAPFVLRVILAYTIALVPINWLVCRFLLRRRELAWAIIPMLALGFAVAVERAAAIDTGYDRACDEIDILELQPGYSRAHLSRFSVLYSTGRENFTISFPGEPSALALPLNANLAIRGEQLTESTWQSTPGPELLDFRVEPRSLAMLRSEQLVNLRGAIFLDRLSEDSRSIVNQSELDLKDAILVDVGVDPEGKNRYTTLGNIPPGEVISLPSEDSSFSDFPAIDPADASNRPDWANLDRFLEPLCSYNWNGPEDKGELRLVAWVADPMAGQDVEPSVDRHRGFTLVVVHLGYGPPPSPHGSLYNSIPLERLGLLDPEQPALESDRP